ncbi:16S rRNA (cytosine(1402)-N(4))-methyltransferase RsmH [Nostocoides jenkinsii]|uniref:Ribosomal RNA small subunit methyltransferase H n=1 Tax=Nostocoides jenkinsii Ben 74 TaxID=1193518 RepID=A0A077MAP6_9MICO|nr:16S rRNA (cytosine(1402)-N(4))-methyltransferase RsmH [Tetrasphaera jenkinsii]CCI51857.1 S-adenosyl-dependent methyltransferase active on membrane-located substrates [Tetrasphaera jenkinsii Ben 74]
MNTQTTARDRHVPVLCARIVDLLAPALDRPGAIVVDGTLGMGGHAEALLEAAPEARLIGIDRDTEALALAGERLAKFGTRVDLVHAVYDELPDILGRLGVETVDAALFDLGVSSLQLDEPERGFAYRFDAPLDMRMDQRRGVTAAEVLNTYDRADLVRILRDYGEERFAPRVASAIVTHRARQAFATTGELVEVLETAIPQASQRTGGHPAKRTFQALRIEVNAELSTWARALPEAIDALAVGGRIAVMSYHSLEDRITKQVLRDGATSSAPPGLPVERPEDAPYLRLLTRGAETADATEQAANPRSASVRVRAAERIAIRGGRR